MFEWYVYGLLQNEPLCKVIFEDGRFSESFVWIDTVSHDGLFGCNDGVFYAGQFKVKWGTYVQCLINFVKIMSFIAQIASAK